MTQKYNDPAGGTPSTAGSQIRIDMYEKKALMEAAKEAYFGQLADVRTMPKHTGKKIRQYHLLPIMDDRNVNDQGLDANGVAVNFQKTIFITRPGAKGHVYQELNAVGEGTDAATALSAAEAKAEDIFKNEGVFDTDYATTIAAITALAEPWTVDTSNPEVPAFGNLYGSSKDIGYVSGKLPTLTETGGIVNRIGHTRIELESTLEKFGFHDSYTQESMDFDSDADREMHIRMENLKAANEIVEDALQMDLLNSAGVVRFGGTATSTDTISGEAGSVSLVNYLDLQKVSIELDDNRCPKNTNVITGSRMIDTKTIDSARILYIGSELQTTVEGMTDQFGNPAFVSREKYGAATKTLRGEIGKIYQFRIVVVPEMMHWAGVGADVVSNTGYRESNGKYNVYPMLVVGDASFTTIGFANGGKGKGKKFTIKHSKPGSPESYAQDRFGETGFHSTKWYYGFMLLRPERIALIKTVAPQ